MKILGLCAYPRESAATRFRLGQFVGPLAIHGIEMQIRPFFNGEQFAYLYASGGTGKKVISTIRAVFRRIGEIVSVHNYDLILVQREAMIFGPAIFEWLFQKIGRVRMVLDLDDATYVPYVSPSYGRLGSFFKFFGKTDKLIRRADFVVCGNRFIAEYVEAKGTRAIVIPTVVDTSLFYPQTQQNEVPVIGWIGTHSTFPFLQRLFPIFERLALNNKFVLKIIGGGRADFAIPGVEIENLEWNIDREIADFQSFDIGLYPMFPIESANEEWINGKSGFKAIQYMAVGVPFVMSPVGVCAEIGEPEKTHLNAETDEDWYNSLSNLLRDASLREGMGVAGRKHSLRHYRLEDQADKLAQVLRGVGIRNN